MVSTYNGRKPTYVIEGRLSRVASAGGGSLNPASRASGYYRSRSHTRGDGEGGGRGGAPGGGRSASTPSRSPSGYDPGRSPSGYGSGLSSASGAGLHGGGGGGAGGDTSRLSASDARGRVSSYSERSVGSALPDPEYIHVWCKHYGSVTGSVQRTVSLDVSCLNPWVPRCKMRRSFQSLC